MSIVLPDGAKVDLSVRQSLVDAVLDHRTVIGTRRWGMIQLYYRAGLAQGDIAEIFSTTRQAVSHELRASFREVAAYLAAQRRKAEKCPPE